MSLLSHAQTYELKGKVLDSLGKPLESANIIAEPLSKQESLQFAISDAKGRYRIQLKKSIEYVLTVSYIGFKEAFLKIKKTETPTSYNFILRSKGIDLDEVTINHEYKPIIIKQDTTVYKVSAFANGNERKMKEILNKIPGIDVDKNGGVTVNGNKVTKLLVENKPFFGGGTKLAVENIPADALENIEVIKNYTEVTFLKGLTDNDDLALNVKLKEDKKKFVFGDVEAGAGDNEYYKTHAGIFYYSPKTSVNFIGDLNNIGEATFTFSDRNRFNGGSSFLSSRPSLGSLNSFAADNKDIVRSDNQFAALNVDYELNDKLSINGYGLFSKLRTGTLNTSRIEYLSNIGITEELRDNNDTKRNTLGVGNVKLDYRPNDKSAWFYNINVENLDSDNLTNLLTSIDGDDSFFNNTNELENFSIKQFLEWHQSYNDTHTTTLVINHGYEKSEPLSSYLTDESFLGGLIPLLPQNEINVQQIREQTRNSLDVLLKHYWVLNNYNHIYSNLGVKYNKERYLTEDFQILDNGTINNFEEDDFGNDIDYNFLDIFYGLEYQAKIGALKIKPSVYVHWYQLDNKQQNITTLNFSKILVEPRLNASYEINRSEGFRLNYRFSNRFQDAKRYANRFSIQGFNRVFRGNGFLENERYHNASLSYNKTSLYRNIYLFGTLSFSRKTRTIRDEIGLQGINQFTTPIQTNNPETNWNFFGSIRKDIGKFGFTLTPRYTRATYIQSVNDLINENRTETTSAGFYINTKNKKWPYIRIGYEKGYNNFRGTANFESEFQTDTFRADMSFEFLKSWIFKTDFESFTNSNDSNTETFNVGNAELRYHRENSAWTFELSATNYLNVDSKNRNTFNDFTVIENTTFILPRIILAKISYKL